MTIFEFSEFFDLKKWKGKTLYALNVSAGSLFS